MHPIIRPAKPTPHEAAVLSALAQRSKAYWGYSAEFMAACRDELTYSVEQLVAAYFHAYLLQQGNQIIGFYALTLRSDPAHCCELEALFVEPTLIGQGHGQRLIKHAKSTAMALGVKLIVVQSDPNAADFYRAAGAIANGTRASGSIPGRFLPLFNIPLTSNNCSII